MKKSSLIKALILFCTFSISIPSYSQINSTGLLFDGLNDRITMPANPAYVLGVSDFTIEMWVKMFQGQKATNDAVLFSYDYLGGGITISGSGSYFDIQIGNDYYTFQNFTVVNDNLCHHLAFVRTGPTVKFYRDGILQNTITHAATASVSNQNFYPIYIGTNGGEYYTGFIHEIRFWNIARSQNDLINTMNVMLNGNESGLIGYWKCNDGAGQYVNDFSSVNNDGFIGITSSAPLFISGCSNCQVPQSNTIVANGPTTFCNGGSVLLTAPAGYTYFWKDALGSLLPIYLNQTFTADHSGTYSCIIGNNCGTVISNVITVNEVTINASITAAGPTSFCAAGSVTLNAATAIGNTYQWRLNTSSISGATLSTYTTSAAGNYDCVVTNTNCSATSNAITVTVNPIPSSMPSFQKTIGGSGNNSARSVIKTADGGFAIVGIYNAFGLDSGSVYVIKLNSSGNLQWATAIGQSSYDEGSSIVQTSDGGYAVTGRHGYLTFEMYVIKLNSSGNLLWTSIMNEGLFDKGYCIIEGPGGSLLISGRAYNFSYYGLLIKLNSAGDLLWSKHYSEFIDGIYSVVKTQDGGYAMAAINQSDNGSLLLAKTDSSGNLLWLKYIGGNGFEGSAQSPNMLVETFDGGLVMTGSTASFGAGSNDVYVVKYSSAGILLWTRTVGNTGDDGGNGITQMDDGGLLIAGYSNSSGAGGYDAYLVKLSNTGVLEWTRTYGGTGDDMASDVVLATPCGGFAFVGSTKSFGNTAGDVYIVETDVTGYVCSNTALANGISGSGGAEHGIVTSASSGATNVVDIVPSSFSTGSLVSICSTACTIPYASIAANGATTFCTGASVTLSTASGTGLTYQWRSNTSNISGATSFSYTTGNTGNYDCLVTNVCGTSTSNSISVNVSSTCLGGLQFTSSTSDRVTIPNSTAYNFGTGDFTVEAWIKASSTQTGVLPAIISKRSNSTSGFLIFLQGGKAAFQLGGINGALGTGPSLIDNACHHIAVSRTGTTVRLYVDGNLITTGINFNQNVTSTHAFWIGGDESNPENLNGIIHDVRMWNLSRTQAQIQSTKDIFLAGTETGLVGYWKMNEGTGQNIQDFSPTANNGVHGSTSAVETIDPAYTLTSCIVSCTTPASITSVGATTFCAPGSVTLNANTGIGLTYQWRQNGSTISGATGSSYVATSSGTYTCLVTSTCGTSTSNSITVTVNTAPAATSIPSGTTIVCRNTTGNIYSIPSVGGATSYTWTVPTGATIFSGQGTTSVSINFGSTAVSGNICVYASNSCGNSTTSCKAITVITANPTTPSSITGSTLPCANSNAVPYSCPVVSNAFSYNWTVPANATIASGQGTNSITVNFGALFTSGNVSVQSVNCYGVSSFRTLFTRGKPSTPSTITGQSTAVCAGTNAAAYSITAVAGATTYIWTAPVNATITSGQGTTSVTVNYGASFVSGTLSVTAGNICGNSAVRTLSISSVSAQPGTITGQSLAVCAGTNGVAYSVAAITGATIYNWTAPLNATIASGQGTRSVTVNYGAAFVSGTLSVTSGNACGTSAARTLSISSITATPGTVTGQVNGVCAGTNAVPYSIAPVTNATSYFWTAPPNATIASGQGTTSVTVNYSATFTTGTLSVKSVNACGMSGARNVTIKSVPSTPGTITGAASVCANQSGVPFSIAAITGATTYNWTVPAGATVASGQGTTSITVNFGTTAGSVKVRSGNACGYSVFKTKTVSIVCREAEIDLSIKGISLFPNPFTDEFTIISENNLSSINIYDVSGRLLETHSTISSDEEIKCGSSLTNGIYFAEIIFSGERRIVKLIKEN